MTISGNTPADRFGKWTIDIPKWRPPSLNTLMRMNPRIVKRVKRRADDLVGVYAALSGLPLVTQKFRPKRQIAITIGYECPIGPDKDNCLKFLLDCLTRTRVIVDDSEKCCEWSLGLHQTRQDHTQIVVNDLLLLDPSQEILDSYGQLLLSQAVGRVVTNILVTGHAGPSQGTHDKPTSIPTDAPTPSAQDHG